MKEALEFFDPDTIAWHSRLARVAAGTSSYDVALSHEFYEDIWIVSGSIVDRSAPATA